MYAKIIKYSSPVGDIWLEEKNGAISRVYLPCVGANIVRPPNINDVEHTGKQLSNITGEQCSPLLENARTQFEEYFNGARRVFDLPLNFDGCTDFMLRVYRELMKVKYGETASYKDIAERVGSPKAYRAVGLANNKNPLAIIVPCHRIVGSDGGLVGYAGGLELKSRLLELERKN